MTINFQDILLIDPANPAIDYGYIGEYYLNLYGNGDEIFSLPLIFPANAVSTTN